MYKNNDLAVRAKKGCELSKEILLRENMKMIYKVANIYSKNKRDFEDIVQEGILGFLISLHKWENRKNSDFTTYAYYWVKFKIADSLLKNKGIKIFAEKRKKERVSFEVDGENLEEKIGSFDEEKLDVYKTEQKEKLYYSLNKLNHNEKKIIYYRYGLGNEKKTLKELGNILNISVSNISKIEKKALIKMRGFLNEEGIYVMSQM